MSFCGKCGAQVSPSDTFCARCGNNLSARPSSGPADSISFLLDLVQGTEHHFSLMGQSVTVSAQMDVFNYYRKKFAVLARKKVNDLRAEYCARIIDLDSFLLLFPEIYRRHRRPLLDTAMDVLSKAEIYDISLQQFEEQHTNDFFLCGEDLNNIVQSFNNTIEANQERKAKMYNMMPGVIFHGLGGFVAAIAVNAAVSTLAEHDIKNANVTPQQRYELFCRINFNALMERVYTDYWRVFLSLTYTLYKRGYGVWYPNGEDNSRANGLFQNLLSGRVPQEKVLSQVALLLMLNPYNEAHMNYLKQRFGITPEITEITRYFSP